MFNRKKQKAVPEPVKPVLVTAEEALAKTIENQLEIVAKQISAAISWGHTWVFLKAPLTSKVIEILTSKGYRYDPEEVTKTNPRISWDNKKQVEEL